MTGILSLASSGLVLAETFEDLSAWTYDGDSSVATSTLNPVGHSGAAAARFHLGGRDVCVWPIGAYAKLTQKLDVLTGANRVTRIFRGPGAVGSVFDDFVDATLDVAMWESSSRGTLSGGIFSLAASGDNLEQKIQTVQNYISAVSSFKCTSNSNWQAFDLVIIKFYAGSILLQVQGHADVNCGAYDNANYHIYKVALTAGSTKLYVDGVLKGTSSTSSPVNAHMMFQNFVAPAETLSIDWIAYQDAANFYKASYAIGSQTLFDQDVETEARPLDNGFFDSGWLSVTPTGSQTIELKLRNAGGSALNKINVDLTWDDLVIMLDTVITVNGMLSGQKIELYNAGGGLLWSWTSPAPGTSTTFDVSSLITTAYGFLGYFKVYDTDGTTLLYTGTTIVIWGGDVYTWVPNLSTQAISAVSTLVYRTGSGLSPGSSVVTVTLTDFVAGTPVSGKTITFTPNLGTCSPTSAVTDVNGQVQTTFTPGSVAGLGGVQAIFGGDATYGPSNCQQLIDIYYTQVVPYASKDFQVFIAGQEVVFNVGSYTLSSDFKPQPFSVSTPSMTVSVEGWWAVEIYRLGTKEFAGRIMHRKRVSGTNPLLTIDGVSEVITLQRRIVNRTYLDDPKNIIIDLLATFPCGITAGSISLFGSNIRLVASYEGLYDALIQIQNATGWLFRLNANKTLDFAPSFGTVQAITILEGNQETESTHEEDWSQLDTTVYAVGAGTGASLVATSTNLTTQLVYGVIEEAILAKNITDIGTLSLRAQQLLAQKQSVRETVDVKWIDDFSVGSYGPFDTVTVTDPDTGLSGAYVIYTLTRDLTDAKLADLALTNRPLTMADALTLIRTVVKDLGVA